MGFTKVNQLILAVHRLVGARDYISIHQLNHHKRMVINYSKSLNSNFIHNIHSNLVMYNGQTNCLLCWLISEGKYAWTISSIHIFILCTKIIERQLNVVIEPQLLNRLDCLRCLFQAAEFLICHFMSKRGSNVIK